VRHRSKRDHPLIKGGEFDGTVRETIRQPEELQEKQQPTGECVEVERQPPEELQQPPNKRLE
jgi:hypothetical protein